MIALGLVETAAFAGALVGTGDAAATGDGDATLAGEADGLAAGLTAGDAAAEAAADGTTDGAALVAGAAGPEPVVAGAVGATAVVGLHAARIADATGKPIPSLPIRRKTSRRPIRPFSQLLSTPTTAGSRASRSESGVMYRRPES
jgi:hypothetical protein